MLSQLYLENIAVIERVSLDFGPGFSALTGETGAGKSILIDAINAILGTRTSKELIRTGAATAKISALFQDLAVHTQNKLREFGVEADEEGSLLLQRTFSRDGKSVCHINGRPATVSLLRDIGVFLINIHGQHDNQRLLSAETHVGYLDNYGKLKPVLEAYQQAYREYKGLAKELRRIRLDESERMRKIDLLTYQIEEIEAACLVVGEQEALVTRKAQILNAEKILTGLTEVYQSLNGDEEVPGAVEAVNRAVAALSGVAAYLQDGQDILERLEEISFALQDCASELSRERSNQDFSSAELADIEERLDLLYRLSLKYGQDIDAILSYLDNARAELAVLENLEESRGILEEKCGRAEELVIQKGEALRTARQEAAKRFTEQMETELSFLDMKSVVFLVEQKEATYTSNGGDAIQFLISTNPGEPPKPLAKIASGGELSRIMLALNNVLTRTDNLDTLIFDEIDTGISGHAAQQVGLKMRQVSTGRQVICVTHLAQLASQADTHYLIEKRVEKGRTFTSVRRLTYSERLTELARIMGNPDSQTMRESAGELLKAAGILETP